MNIPKVSIGMPVYNGEAFISDALDSLLAQTFIDFELIISDNASVDTTEAICRKYAAKDKRVRYVRHSKNNGAAGNFKFVLDAAIGEYFMWAAYDDKKSLDYLQLNFDFLEKNSGFVASTCRTRFEGKTFDAEKMGDKILVGDYARRLIDSLGVVHANARFYSLMRRCVLKENPFIWRDYLGVDWSIMHHVLSYGCTNRLEAGCVELGLFGASNSRNIFRAYRKKNIHWLLPMWDMSVSVILMMKKFSFKNKVIVLYRLVVVNIRSSWINVLNELRHIGTGKLK